MNCFHCTHPMTILGCNVTGRPFHWCGRCGAISTCDGNNATPSDAGAYGLPDLPDLPMDLGILPSPDMPDELKW